jgi:aspartate/methionine/tyrosine aminotransferase
MNTIKEKMNNQFASLKGGLFETVTKADVGEGVGELIKQGVDIMAWADPFFPDPSIPDSVKRAMIESLEEGFPSHYSMPIGKFELREAIARKIQRKTGLVLNPSRNIIVTPGSDSGLLYAMMPFIKPGDEVLVPDPSYPSNFLNPKLLGGVTVPVPLYASNNWQLSVDELEARVTSKTKMLLLCHPNNPTTTVFRKETLKAIAEFVIKHDLILVCDQAFEDHIYDDIDFVAPATLEGMWKRTVTVCSISKGFGLSGFRIGYIYADDAIMDVLYGGAVNVLGAAATVTSIGAIVALDDQEFLEDVHIRLARRRDLVHEVFKDNPKIKVTKSESGFLTWIDVSRLGSSAEVVSYILENAKILVNEGTPYGEQGEGYIRIVTGCFLDDEKAITACRRINEALIALGKQKGV